MFLPEIEKRCEVLCREPLWFSAPIKTFMIPTGRQSETKCSFIRIDGIAGLYKTRLYGEGGNWWHAYLVNQGTYFPIKTWENIITPMFLEWESEVKLAIQKEKMLIDSLLYKDIIKNVNAALDSGVSTSRELQLTSKGQTIALALQKIKRENPALTSWESRTKLALYPNLSYSMYPRSYWISKQTELLVTSAGFSLEHGHLRFSFFRGVGFSPISPKVGAWLIINRKTITEAIQAIAQKIINF